jgi:hypothetical protein
MCAVTHMRTQARTNTRACARALPHAATASARVCQCACACVCRICVPLNNRRRKGGCSGCPPLAAAVPACDAAAHACHHPGSARPASTPPGERAAAAAPRQRRGRGSAPAPAWCGGLFDHGPRSMGPGPGPGEASGRAAASLGATSSQCGPMTPRSINLGIPAAQDAARIRRKRSRDWPA